MADWSGMFLPKTRMNEDSLLESCNYRWPLVNPFEGTREWLPAINPLLLSKHAALCTKPNQNIWNLHSVQGTIPRSIAFLSIYCHKYNYKHQCYNLLKQNKRYKRTWRFRYRNYHDLGASLNCLKRGCVTAKLFCKKEMITRFLFANDFFNNNKITASCQTSITPITISDVPQREWTLKICWAHSVWWQFPLFEFWILLDKLRHTALLNSFF